MVKHKAQTYQEIELLIVFWIGFKLFFLLWNFHVYFLTSPFWSFIESFKISINCLRRNHFLQIFFESTNDTMAIKTYKIINFHPNLQITRCPSNLQITRCPSMFLMLIVVFDIAGKILKLVKFVSWKLDVEKLV